MSRTGRLLVGSAVVLVVGVGAALALQTPPRATLDCGRFTLIASPRVDTGYQRAERVAFAGKGRLLAVTCPRYDRLVLYRVAEELEPFQDISLEGRPMAVASADDRLYVLQRPPGDTRHVEEGFWRAYDFQGRPIGPKLVVGWDPDDMVLSDDGRLALVITSGRAEGDPQKPSPALVVVDLDQPDAPRIRGRLSFDRSEDNPSRVALHANRAAVSLEGTNDVAWIDLADIDHPLLTRRIPLTSGVPGPLAFDADGTLLVTDVHAGKLWDLGTQPGPSSSLRLAGEDVGEVIQLRGESQPAIGRPETWTFRAKPEASALEVIRPNAKHQVGSLPLRGATGRGTIRPRGLAATIDGGWKLAVADRSGGVRLITFRGEHGLP